MNADEVYGMLVFIARFDNREVTDELADAWAPLFVDVNVLDAKAAVQDHYRTSRAYVMPSDIISYTRRLRAERVADFTRSGRSIDLLVTADPSDTAAWMAERQRIHALIMSGQVDAHTPREAIQAAASTGPRELPGGAA